MVDQIQDIDSLKKNFEEKVEGITVLFLDLSSQCTGYSIVHLDFLNKKATFKKAGAMWFGSDWKNQEKYHYLFSAIVNYFNIVDAIDFCVCETYMLNPKKRMGSLVGPEMHGAVQVALAEIGIKYMSMPVQTWRKHLGIKKDIDGDYKKPTHIIVEKYTVLPKEIKSNITGGIRSLPNDLTDALGIAMGSIKKWGIVNWDFSKIKFQEDVRI